jgi:hypothetical protein
MRFWNQPFTVTVGFYPGGTPRAPPPVGAFDAAGPQSDRRYRQ